MSHPILAYKDVYHTAEVNWNSLYT